MTTRKSQKAASVLGKPIRARGTASTRTRVAKPSADPIDVASDGDIAAWVLYGAGGDPSRVAVIGKPEDTAEEAVTAERLRAMTAEDQTFVPTIAHVGLFADRAYVLTHCNGWRYLSARCKTAVFRGVRCVRVSKIGTHANAQLLKTPDRVTKRDVWRWRVALANGEAIAYGFGGGAAIDAFEAWGAMCAPGTPPQVVAGPTADGYVLAHYNGKRFLAHGVTARDVSDMQTKVLFCPRVVCVGGVGFEPASDGVDSTEAFTDLIEAIELAQRALDEILRLARESSVARLPAEARAFGTKASNVIATATTFHVLVSQSVQASKDGGTDA